MNIKFKNPILISQINVLIMFVLNDIENETLQDSTKKNIKT
jgi:hypothetical protein